jgi:hypothetical protein
MEKNSQKLLNYGTIVLIIGAIVVLFAPYILTRNWFGISFLETGQIGDTIGGITAPFVNLISAILVYLALYAQVEANKLVQKQIDDQKQGEIEQKHFANLLEIYKQVKDDFDNCNFTDYGPGILSEIIKLTGREAIRIQIAYILQTYCRLTDKNTFIKYTQFVELLLMLDALYLLTEMIHSAVLAGSDKLTIFTLTQHLFSSRIIVLMPNKCTYCDNTHKLLPEDLSDLLHKITKNLENPDRKI